MQYYEIKRNENNENTNFLMKKKKKKKKKKYQESLCKYKSSILYYELAHDDSWYNMLEYLKIQRKYR